MAYHGDFEQQAPNKLQIEVTDSGAGFDFAKRQDPQFNDANHKWGLALLESLCESLSYCDGGSTATAIYAFR